MSNQGNQNRKEWSAPYVDREKDEQFSEMLMLGIARRLKVDADHLRVEKPSHHFNYQGVETIVTPGGCNPDSTYSSGTASFSSSSRGVVTHTSAGSVYTDVAPQSGNTSFNVSNVQPQNVGDGEWRAQGGGGEQSNGHSKDKAWPGQNEGTGKTDRRGRTQ